MRHQSGRASAGCLLLLISTAAPVFAQKPLTWDEVRERFRRDNPTLRAARLNIEESKAQEITAYLRPNPSFTALTDGTQLTPSEGIWRPFAGTTYSPNFSYLHERRHKRELRLESAQKGTGIATENQADIERTLLFDLRNQFVQVLQAKAVLALARENLSYYDHVLAVSSDRFKAGDIARVDLDRLELQRVTYESDVRTAEVNLRTAKIHLLMLLNDRTPIAQFDVTGPFDFRDQLMPLEEFRSLALATRPDLRAAVESVELARINHRLAFANGSTDPMLGSWWTHNSSFANPFAHDTLGASVSIPLRIFDRNQGEKLRTQIEIGRSEQLRDAARALVSSDVDSAYETVNSNLTLLRPYKARYLQQAVSVRDTIAFSYQHGGASLLDFLNAQNDYRTVQRNYLTLIGAYLTAASQLSLAAGREVIP